MKVTKKTFFLSDDEDSDGEEEEKGLFLNPLLAMKNKKEESEGEWSVDEED
jgi:peptide deformylase